MNKHINTIGVIILILALLQSCTKKEEDIQPSTDSQGYVVPQGNNSFDTTILNFYKKYGYYLLYNFKDKDTYWTPSAYKNSTQSASGSWSSGYLVTPANPTYVKKQLSLLNSQWFGLYSDKFLKEFLPVKIMLCASIDSVWGTSSTSNGQTVYSKRSKPVAAWYNYDNICVNYGSADIDTMKTRDSISFLAKTNLIFIQSIIGRNLNKATPDFGNLTNYTLSYTTYAMAYTNGILYPYFNGPSADRDWGLYMQAMISTSQNDLTRSVANTDATFKGILNPTKDTNGTIRKRYDIIRNYFIKNYNVDLQAIGDMANK